MPNPIWQLAPGVLHVFPALAVQFVPAGGAPGAQGQATTPPGVPLKHCAPAGTGVGPPAGTLVVSQYHVPRTPIATANKTKIPTAPVITNRLLILVSKSFIGSSSRISRRQSQTRCLSSSELESAVPSSQRCWGRSPVLKRLRRTNNSPGLVAFQDTMKRRSAPLSLRHFVSRSSVKRFRTISRYRGQETLRWQSA